MGYEFQPEDILAPCIYLTHQQKTCIQTLQTRTFPGTAVFALNFSHLAVAIVAVLGLPCPI